MNFILNYRRIRSGELVQTLVVFHDLTFTITDSANQRSGVLRHLLQSLPFKPKIESMTLKK